MLNFHDAIVYEEDVELFRGNNWLNSSTIHFAFELLKADYACNEPDLVHNLELMDPSVVSWIHFSIEEDEYSDFME